ncbi:MAG: hypothetical protein WBG11_12060 [Methylocella sp.]
MDAPTYLEQFVDPAIADFEKCPHSRRHACHACLVTFHTLDYIWYPKKTGSRRNDFRKESNAFAIVDRVAHAFKHVKTGDDKNKHNRHLLVEHVYSRPQAMCGAMQCGNSRLGDRIGGVALWGEDNSDLLPAVREAVEFLRTKCKNRAGDVR